MDKQHLLSLVIDEVKSGVHAGYHVRVIWRNGDDAGDFDKEMMGVQRQWQTEKWFFECRAGSKIYSLKQLLKLHFGGKPFDIDLLKEDLLRPIGQAGLATQEVISMEKAIEHTFLGVLRTSSLC